MKGFWKISQLAKRTGLTVRALPLPLFQALLGKLGWVTMPAQNS